MVELTIRPFVTDDLAKLQAIRQAAFAPIFAALEQTLTDKVSSDAFKHLDQEQADHLTGLCGEGTDTTVLVGVIGGEIIGFVSYSVASGKTHGTIDLNAVHPDHSGRGIGTALYEHACHAMAAKGVESVEVSTAGDLSHAPARRAYEKAGFGHAFPWVTLYRKL